MKKIIDLHVHTNVSDGELSPKEVIDIAVKNGVYALAITDHDTIDAYNDELFEYAKRNNLILIPAVEISTKIKKCGIHVLGYNFDLTNSDFRNKLKLLRNARHDYLYNVAFKLKELGYIVNVDELDKIEAVTKAHIALDIVSNLLNKKLLLDNFGYIPSKGEFIETVMNEGCPAYVKKATITPSEAVELIRKAGGKAVLAHPVAYKYEDGLTDEDIFELIKEMKVEAIEANYIYIDRNNNIIDECGHWKKIAADNNMVCTIGSDFHKDNGIKPVIGVINHKIDLNEEEINRVLDYLEN